MLVVLTLALAGFVGRPTLTIVCLILIGVSAGLYIVPMYTLLQHRAPKASKGSMVATSNFLNVTGGLVAIVVFYFVTYALQTVFGLTLTSADAERDPETLKLYISQLSTARAYSAGAVRIGEHDYGARAGDSMLAAARLFAAGAIVAADTGAAAAEGGIYGSIASDRTVAVGH